VSREPRSIPRHLSSGDFAARQWSYFREVDEAKFRWQTATPVFAASERHLVSVVAGEGRLLEVGCGEGGNLFHLGPRAGLTVGLDYACAKLVFASGAIPWGRFAGADALSLPFRSGAFDRVLIRDVLHHLPRDRQREAVAELFRVCRSGGEVVVIEPNGRNPLMAASYARCFIIGMESLPWAASHRLHVCSPGWMRCWSASSPARSGATSSSVGARRDEGVKRDASASRRVPRGARRSRNG